MEELQWDEAKKFEQRRNKYLIQRCANLMHRPIKSLNSDEKNLLRSLGISYGFLGEIQRELGQPDCVEHYINGLEIMKLIGDKAVVSKTCLILGFPI